MVSGLCFVAMLEFESFVFEQKGKKANRRAKVKLELPRGLSLSLANPAGAPDLAHLS